MSLELRRRIFHELDSLTLIDPHTHINPHAPASTTLADILGYHYYTELAHSAGMPKDQIEQPGLDPREKVRRLIEKLGPIDNTVQYSWFVEMASAFFGFQGDRIDPDQWDELYDAAAARMSSPDWAEQVLRKSKLEAVFLTNDFDDSLEGFDTQVYIPCLRTDDLVFHLAKPDVQARLERSSGVTLDGAESVRQAIGRLFEHFTANNARACAISLPPDFSPAPVPLGRAETAIDALLRDGESVAESHRRAAANFVFWTLAEFCDEFGLPFDLMIGVNRGVYRDGVHQGRDLYDSRVSLIQYRELFNAFPRVTFPISVLASVTNQELASYAWIFPNVVANGHWWYSNTPTFIEHDAAARLEAVPRTKLIGYYSDMYKLEFALPKFAMYKRILAKILAERFVIDRGWTESRAIMLGCQILRDNVERIFPEPQSRPPSAFASTPSDFDSHDDASHSMESEDESESFPVAAAAASAAAFSAAASVGMQPAENAESESGQSDSSDATVDEFADEFFTGGDDDEVIDTIDAEDEALQDSGILLDPSSSEEPQQAASIGQIDDELLDIVEDAAAGDDLESLDIAPLDPDDAAEENFDDLELDSDEPADDGPKFNWGDLRK